MANTQKYDPDEHLFSPSPDVVCQVLSDVASPDFFELSNTDTKSGIYPSQGSSNSSPPQSISYSPNLSIDLSLNLSEHEIIDFSLMTQPSEKLQIVAQPKAVYRERYCSETDPSKHRAQRFIRADDDNNKYEYPTVQIPKIWCDFNRDLYIRVTLVTIFTDKVPVICIHPYAIDTQETDVLQDSHNNSLYFRITKEEIFSGQKSFRISRKKMIQHDLRSYGSLLLFDLNQKDIQRVMNSHDAKQIIDTYQLWKSQLVFTIAERFNNKPLPVPVPFTSVISQIMCDEAGGRRKSSMLNNTHCISIHDDVDDNNDNDDTVKCVPRKGDWSGGDEILMIIPKLDKRKVFNIYFDYGSMGKMSDIKVSYVDFNTIYFQTPPCLVLAADENFAIPIIVTQNDLIIARIDFVYLTPIKPTINLCSRCQTNIMNNNNNNNKRRHFLLEPTEFDGNETLTEQMKNLSTEEKTPETSRRRSSDDITSKADKYLGQLQDAIIEFVRTNNPSRLFRRTRLLIAKADENPPPLDDAIRRGHIDLALKLIEQVLDMPASNGLLERENDDGEIPLLLAAKLNQWRLIEAILKKRSDLIEKTDKQNNNILHLLANVSEDKANETMKNVMGLLVNETKINLLGKKNKDNQTAIELAQAKNNTQCVNLLKKSIKSSIDTEKKIS